MNNLLKIVSNVDGLYEGNLHHYYRATFFAPNANLPYHNFRHSMHVTCEAYEAAVYHEFPEQFGKRMFRALLIATMLHDYNHQGKGGPDALNIFRALDSLQSLLLPEDWDLKHDIETLIRGTQYPHIECEETLGIMIIRDADIAQTLQDVWMQQVIFGLAEELGIKPLRFLELQEEFLSKLEFKTSWALNKFQEKRVKKILEVRQHLAILTASD